MKTMMDQSALNRGLEGVARFTPLRLAPFAPCKMNSE